VVEYHDLHVRSSAEAAQVADALRVGGVDDDELADLLLVDQPQVEYGQAFAVQGDEFAHVGVERSGEDYAAL